MIIGLGSDIVHIPRIAALIERFGERFLTRIYTEEERAQGERLVQNTELLAAYYAKRFAAKEAIVKALGIGIREGIRFVDIAISNDAYGKPVSALHGEALRYLKVRSANATIHLSLSDDYPVAFAVAVIEGR